MSSLLSSIESRDILLLSVQTISRLPAQVSDTAELILCSIKNLQNISIGYPSEQKGYNFMNYYERALALKEETVAHRRFFLEELHKLGISAMPCGNGVSAIIGKGQKCLLLRADMDALPMAEESGLDFACTSGTEAHTCGHDFHAAMLLTAAKMLQENAENLQGTVKLMFQPAEETFEGARDMITHGILKDPVPAAALAFHVTAGRTPPGVYMYNAESTMMFAVNGFEMNIHGTAAHGSGDDHRHPRH